MFKLNKIILVCSLSVLVIASSTAYAKPDCNALQKIEERESCMIKNADCSTPEWLTNADRIACSQTSRAMNKQLLDQQKRKLKALLDRRELTRLEKAEKSYQLFVDAQCGFESPPNDGGTMGVVEFSNCLESFQKQRLVDYQRMYKNFLYEKSDK